MVLKINYYFYTQHFGLIMQMDCDLFKADIKLLHHPHEFCYSKSKYSLWSCKLTVYILMANLAGHWSELIHVKYITNK